MFSSSYFFFFFFLRKEGIFFFFVSFLMLSTSQEALTSKVQSEVYEREDTTNATPVIPSAVQYKYYRAPEGFKRLRTKRKVALLFGYIGERYCGLQWNHDPERPTVEEALLRALYECDMISLTNMSNPKVMQLLNFERASRTDKGVHALCNVVSVNVMLPYHPDYVEKEKKRMLEAASIIGVKNSEVSPAPATLQEKKSEEAKDASNDNVDMKYSLDEAKKLLRLALPSDIHLYDIIPVTRSFNAYLCCQGRRYEYLLPTFALMTADEYSKLYFSPDIAASHPNLKDIGFQLVKRTPLRRPHHVEQALAERRKKEMGAEKAEEGSVAAGEEEVVVPPGGRKGGGHFPKSKRRREELCEQRKIEIEEKKKRKENAVQRSSEEGVDDVQKDQETVDLNDPQAVEAFLTTHYATHFQDHLFESMILYKSIPVSLMQRVGQYRIATSQLQYIRSLFHMFEGTHCYHNFTPGGRSTDASCHRYMTSIQVSDPMLWNIDDPLLEASIEHWTPSRFFAPDQQLMEACDEARRGVSHSTEPSGLANDEDTILRNQLRQRLRDLYPNGIEVVRIELDGQSFMLNQIRKMIGAVVGINASGLPASFLIEKLFDKRIHMQIPMVPANGLVLSFMDFSGYQNRLQRIQNNGNNGKGKTGIDVEALMPLDEISHQKQITASVMIRNEMGNDLMGKWMRSLRHALRLAWNVDVP